MSKQMTRRLIIRSQLVDDIADLDQQVCCCGPDSKMAAHLAWKRDRKQAKLDELDRVLDRYFGVAY